MSLGIWRAPIHRDTHTSNHVLHHLLEQNNNNSNRFGQRIPWMEFMAFNCFPYRLLQIIYLAWAIYIAQHSIATLLLLISHNQLDHEIQLNWIKIDQMIYDEFNMDDFSKSLGKHLLIEFMRWIFQTHPRCLKIKINTIKCTLVRYGLWLTLVLL